MTCPQCEAASARIQKRNVLLRRAKKDIASIHAQGIWTWKVEPGWWVLMAPPVLDGRNRIRYLAPTGEWTDDRAKAIRFPTMVAANLARRLAPKWAITSADTRPRPSETEETGMPDMWQEVTLD